ncbi:hypothetical protein [Prauserella flavalba]|nr:hypothetical protein [Prauserella flavalba]
MAEPGAAEPAADPAPADPAPAGESAPAEESAPEAGPEPDAAPEEAPPAEESPPGEPEPGGEEAKQPAEPTEPAKQEQGGDGPPNEFRDAVHEQEPPVGSPEGMNTVADEAARTGETATKAAEESERAWAETESGWNDPAAAEAGKRAAELAESDRATGELANSVSEAAGKSAQLVTETRQADEQSLATGEGDWLTARALLPEGERQVAEAQTVSSTVAETRERHAAAEAGMRGIWDGIFDGAGDVLGDAAGAVKDIGNKTDELIDEAGEHAGNFVSDVAESAGELIGGPVGRAVGEGVGDALGGELKTGGDILGEYVDGVLGTVGNGAEMLGEVSDEIGDGIREGDPWQIPGEVGAEIGEGVAENVDHWVETGNDIGAAIGEGVGTDVENLAETGAEIGEAFGELDSATDQLRDAGDVVVESALHLGEAGNDVIDGAGSAVGAGLAALGQAEAGLAVAGTADAAGDAVGQAALTSGAGFRNSVYDAAQGLDGTDRARTVYIPHKLYPHSAQHIDEAQSGTIWHGHQPQSNHTPMGRVFEVDRDGAAGRRKEAIDSLPRSSTHDRDEYPPAVAKTTGEKSVKYIPFSDNRAAGSAMGNQINGRDAAIQRQLDGTGLPFFGDGRVDNGDLIELRTFR